MKKVVWTLMLLSGCVSSRMMARSPATAEYLRCEYRVDPQGIDEAHPRFFWEMRDTRRGARQTAYRIWVSSTPEGLAADKGDLWDTGKVMSDRSIQIVYEGKPLVSRMRCYWKVRIWDAEGVESKDSPSACWSMGVLPPDTFSAQWIGPEGTLLNPERPGGTNNLTLGCMLLRKGFDTHGAIRRATVYASALGIYRLEINGQPVGNDYLTPDWTDYNKRVYYNTYDVTPLIRPNAPNAIGGVLAAGWYSGAIGWKQQRALFGDRNRLFVQLEIEREDGSVQTVVSDGSWKQSFGPYLEGEYLNGETYDATREIAGWSSPGLDDAAWQPVAVTPSVPAVLQAFPGVPVRETGTLRPVAITEPKPGVYIFDMGQNFAGFARLKARGPRGTRVALRFAEMLNPDGTLYTTNLRSARATDTYVLKGTGEEAWQPHFTFHGFRYVEVTGYPGKPTANDITGVVINSKIPMTGTFACSSPMVTKLYQNVLWTQRANYISVPTDCPQRDERLGWTGDAQTFVRAGTYNADSGAFYSKWLVDLEDGQSADGAFPDVAPHVVATGGGTPAWADAGTICPWTIAQVYDDTRLLEKHYAAMTRWVACCQNNSTNLLRPASGYGDWLSIKADTPKDVIATAYFAHSAKLTAQAARRLGKTADAEKYDALFEQIKAAFNAAYVDAEGHVKGDTQTGYVLALGFDLLPVGKRSAAARYLAENIRARDTHLSTGFVGTSLLMPVLSSVGETALAYRLLLNDTFPSWGFSIKHGATSIWERWDGWTPEKGFQSPGMNSFAHYSFGAVAQWMFQSVAGIDLAEPGYRAILIRPQPAEGLTWVKASYHSIQGMIASEWKTEKGRLMLAVTVPANTTATICLPTSDAASVTEGGKPVARVAGVRSVRGEPNEARFEVGAGTYAFAVPWTK